MARKQNILLQGSSPYNGGLTRDLSGVCLKRLHHLADMMIPIDLDDGVKHNYELFADILAKIK